MHITPFNESSLARALGILAKGGVVAHATETCYGLACDLNNIDAVKKLFAIKERPGHQPVSGLFTSVNEAKKFVDWNDRAEELSKHLPGPLTMILPMKSDANLHPTAEASTGAQTLGVRVSSHPHAQALVAAFGSPISTTSANVHGMPNPYSAEDISQQFAGKSAVPDLILDSGTLPRNPPSTVVDCTKEEVEQRRKGDLTV